MLLDRIRKSEIIAPMARLRQIPPPFLYAAAEVETAFGLQGRTIALLNDLGLAPRAPIGGGRGKERLFDSRGLAQIAIFASLYWTGLEAVPAGRVAKAIFEGFDEVYGRPPSGLYQRSREWAGKIEELRTHPDWAPIADAETTDDSIIYAAARRSGRYAPGETWKSDLHFELVDRQFGFTGNPDTKLGAPWSLSGRRSHMQPAFRLTGLTRGGDVTARRIYDEFPAGWNEPDSPAGAQACAIEEEFFAAYDAPRGKLSLNVSRAIRAGHDRIFALRNQDASASYGGRDD